VQQRLLLNGQVRDVVRKIVVELGDLEVDVVEKLREAQVRSPRCTARMREGRLEREGQDKLCMQDEHGIS